MAWGSWSTGVAGRALHAARGLAAQLHQAATDAEQFENDLIAGGVNSDQATMAAGRHAMEQTALSSAAWNQVAAELGKYAPGGGYAASGYAASTGYLRP